MDLLELQHFLGQYGIVKSLLTEIQLWSDKVFRMANYVSHGTDRLTEEGGTSILVRRRIDQCALPAQGIKHLEATAIQVTPANKPVKNPAD